MNPLTLKRYGIHWLDSGRFPGGIFFALFASPGLLFLLAGLATGRKTRPESS